MTGPPPIARRLRIHGVVQGVGFRQSLRYEAQSLGVAGWVRNRSDGTVEALLLGDPAQVDALVRWAHQGPRSARVTRVDVAEAVEEVKDKGAGSDFLCHPTL